VFLGKAIESIHWLTTLAKNYPENTTFKLRLFQFILEVSGYTLPTIYIDIIMYDRENPDQTLSAMRI
jgi:hypothetical protein